VKINTLNIGEVYISATKTNFAKIVYWFVSNKTKNNPALSNTGENGTNELTDDTWLWGVGLIDIRGQVSCEDYACAESQEVKTPKISLKVLKSENYPNLSLCENETGSNFTGAFTGGFFLPLFDIPRKRIKDELLVPFNVQACFNKETKFWNFKVNDGNGFEFRAIEDLCTNLTEDEKLIRNELDLLERIPDDEVCQALKDFEETRRYYGVGGNIYRIKEAYKAHEKVHELRFKLFIIGY